MGEGIEGVGLGFQSINRMRFKEIEMDECIEIYLDKEA